MRITFGTQLRHAAVEINQAATRLAEAQQQVASGRRISRASDDPTGAAAAVGDRVTIGALSAFTATVDSTTSRLTLVDSALSNVVDKLSSAQTAVVSASGSVPSASQKQAAIATLKSVREALVSDFNGQFQGAYVFSGTRATTAPFSLQNGVVSGYQGNASTMSVDVSRSRQVQTSFDASTITQGSDAQDVFTVIDGLIADIGSGNTDGVAAGQTALGRAFTRATQAQSSVGASLAALDDLRQSLSTESLAVKNTLSKTEDANLAQAATEMSTASTAYQAALSAFSKLGNTSLMDYLK